MAALIYLDTHVVAWLYAGRPEYFSPKAAGLMNEEDILISPIVQLELQYLYQIGKIDQPGRTVTDDLEQRIGLRFCDLSFADVVASALDLDWTRDPFDRMIVGHASLNDATLITKDSTIHGNYAGAVWL